MNDTKSQFVMFGILAGIAQTKIELDNNVCGLERQEVEKSSKILQDAINDNKELKQLYKNYQEAVDKFHYEIMQQYYKEGFFFGSQFMLDILGYEKKDKESIKKD